VSTWANTCLAARTGSDAGTQGYAGTKVAKLRAMLESSWQPSVLLVGAPSAELARRFRRAGFVVLNTASGAAAVAYGEQLERALVVAGGLVAGVLCSERFGRAWSCIARGADGRMLLCRCDLPACLVEAAVGALAAA
jgi:hypothetical protein